MRTFFAASLLLLKFLCSVIENKSSVKYNNNEASIIKIFDSKKEPEKYLLQFASSAIKILVSEKDPAFQK